MKLLNMIFRNRNDSFAINTRPQSDVFDSSKKVIRHLNSSCEWDLIYACISQIPIFCVPSLKYLSRVAVHNKCDSGMRPSNAKGKAKLVSADAAVVIWKGTCSICGILIAFPIQMDLTLKRRQVTMTAFPILMDSVLQRWHAINCSRYLICVHF